MSRRKFSILTALALATTMLIVPGAAAADPVGECPSGDWALIDADDPSVADKAASKDAKGNGDGDVCVKVNKKGKFSIKDNR